MLVIWYLLFRDEKSRTPLWLFIAGLCRTAALAGMIYIPAVDDHDTHDYCLTIYLSLTLVWFFGLIDQTKRTKNNNKAILYRKRIAYTYCAMFIPLLHYFTQHRMYQVPGASSKYAFFEWISIALDLLYDCVATLEFDSLELRVYDIEGVTKSIPLDLYARSHYV